jgi:hypothetical protein
MESSTELKSFSSAAIEPSLLAVPAGYAQVAPPDIERRRR